ncbi:MAG: hypothetical protein QOD85_361, partial [Gaiellaceae bacterium]|nr:hypothetical protein [Gaiellaceae bacterium]
FRYRQPHDRVTLETMPVRILRPDHFALRFPNQIVPADFDGWVTDRGLYFFSEWSDQYEALLGCADPGEEEKQGGLLIAECGHGTYVYCGYSLFRQLSAGVPGAFRLFANLLALPEARNTTAYVGRELEQSLLVGTFERAAQQRSCQLVTIVGESGMGKSRLCAELLGLTEDHPRPIRWRQGHCLPYGEGVAFWALGEIVKAECGILESDSAEQAQAKLEGALPAGDPEVAWLRARLEPLIGVGGEAASVEESFTAWRRVLEGWSEARETILVFEDLHWADDALLSFLEHLADWAQHVPLLLLCTARPELYERHPSWAAGLRNATTINLVPLSDEDTARLIARLLERAVLPAETQRALLERAGGNPLFAEEFVRLLADSGSRLSAVEQVPETVQALIAARLDTLSPERKDLLERAAILGKAFWVGALVAMGAGQPRDVELALHELARKGIVRRVRTSSMEGQAEYEFWHLLVRDVCYAQMPPMARAARHRVAARWLEDTLGDRAEDGADVLAHHYLQALELSRAADEDAVFEELEGAARRCLVLAGERALALDGASALASFARALELVPSGHTDRASVLERYGHAAHIAGRPQEARAALEEAIALHKEQQDALAAGRGLTLLVPVLWALGDPRRTEVGAEAVALLEQEPAGPELVAAYAQQSGVHVISSELPEAVATAARAVECAALLGLPEPARALGFGGSARAYMGDRRGLDEMRRALALAVERGRSDDAGVVYANLGLLIWEHEGARSACEHFEAGAAFCERRGAAGNLLYIRVLSLVALAASGHPGQALTRIQALGEQEEAIGFIPLLVELMSLKLRLRAARGECAGVAREPEETAARARETGVPSTIAIGLNAASDVLLATNRREEALACLVELADGPGLAGLSAELPFQVPQFVRNVLALSAPELALRVTQALNPTTPLREHSVVTCRALLAEHAGELAHAAELFEDAAERWRRLTGEPERAYALLGQGRCLLGLGEARGGGPLREAAQLFASLGYRPALAETEALLRDYEATAV